MGDTVTHILDAGSALGKCWTALVGEVGRFGIWYRYMKNPQRESGDINNIQCFKYPKGGRTILMFWGRSVTFTHW